jgi:predicted DNA-binding transcriptional regulator AlpA
MFLISAEVAGLLDLTRHTFLLRRETLIDQHGFPEPMPHSASPLRWRRDQVEAWIAQAGMPRAVPAERPRGPNVYLMEEARRA